MARSPQVILRERDESSFPATTSETVVAIVGYATKGPIGKATQLSGRNAFENTFGSIPKNAPWGHLAAYKAFRQGNVIYYRIANDSATAAEAIVRNYYPESAGYQKFARESIIDYGSYDNDSTYSFNLTVDGEESARTISITSPETGDWELSAVASAINEQLVSVYDSETEGATAFMDGGKIKIESESTGTSSTVLIEEDGDATNDLLELLEGVEDAVDGADEVEASTTDTIKFIATEKGSDTNKISVVKNTDFDPVEGEDIITVSVFFDGEEEETFEEVSLDPNSDNFFARLMNRESDNDGSALVNVEYEQTGSGDLQFPDGEYDLGNGDLSYEDAGQDPEMYDYDHKKGTDGVPASGGAGLYVNAFASNSDLANSEKFDYHILLTPDNGSQTVQNSAISLCESRRDVFYIADSPYGLSYTEVVDWHNGQGHGRDAALNSSFTGVYWPWLKEWNPGEGEYLWCPPSVFMGEKLLEVDSAYAPWYAPAGDLRGRLVANDSETSPSLNQRDFIYGRPNAVNPIVNFSTKGIIIYGQKTTLRSRSALDRVNVRRMAIYASKLIKESMEGLIFEPHVPDSWERAADFIRRILEPIRRDNGLEDYQVIIDGTTNTQDAIANNTMKGIVRLVPVNAIETIDLSITFLSPGVSID